MTFYTIEKELKKFVIEQYESAKKYKNDISPLTYRAIAFGALQFGINNLFPKYNKNLADWWEREMWDKFTKLIRER